MSDAITSFKGEHRFLSNFYDSPLRLEAGSRGLGIRVDLPTAEHLYQVSKVVWFTELTHHDTSVWLHEAKTMTPGQVKRAAQEVTLDLPRWLRHRVAVMRWVVRQKFASSASLARLLLATGDAELVEGNTWGDTFWGVCDGEGENHLGRILMDVRADIAWDRDH